MRVERVGAVAVLRMQSGKVNAISSSMLSALSQMLDELGDAQAALLIGEGNAFSAGLDLPALIDLDERAMRAFMDQFDEVMLRLFRLAVPLVAAVNGHAIAGGCVLALQADVRIAADRDARIGLNETQLGLGLPALVIESLRAQVSPQALAAIALEGRLYSPREALSLGLVHEVVPQAQLEDAALSRAQALAALPPAGIRSVKAALRAPFARAARQADKEQWLSTWFSPPTQQQVRAAVARLKSR